jgi:hypothetical protein
MILNTLRGIVTYGILTLHKELGVYLDSVICNTEQHTPDSLITTGVSPPTRCALVMGMFWRKFAPTKRAFREDCKT